MDMVNDSKDIRLDTPQAVKEALASGKDLYNPQTGEFWWKYNDTGSIANTYIHLDDPNLLAVIDNPDFDLFEDIVGWLNYTGYITDSPDYYAENADDYPDAPDYDERDAVFAQIASEDDWVVATPENVRKAVQSHMAEHGGEVIRREGGVTLRDWYMQAYPEDPLGSKINPVVTFDDALSAVPTGGSFYDSIGIADSVARERIFEELCNRYGYTYDEVYDSWLHESPLPSPAISQQPEKIAVAAGYRFNLVDSREASGIDLKGCGTVVTVDGHDYEIMKGATYEDSHKVDDLLDSHGDKPISAFRKQPQGMSLKQAVREAREASAKLTEKNGGPDDPTGKDER